MAKIHIDIIHILFRPSMLTNFSLLFLQLVFRHKIANTCWHFWYMHSIHVLFRNWHQMIWCESTIYHLFSFKCIGSHFFLELLTVFKRLGCLILRWISNRLVVLSCTSSTYPLWPFFERSKFRKHTYTTPEMTFLAKQSQILIFTTLISIVVIYCASTRFI